MHAVPDQDSWWWKIAVRLRSGKPIGPGEWPDPPPSLENRSSKQVFWGEDMVNTVDDLWVVSSRLRAFLEEHAPGVAEYLPVQLRGPGTQGKGPYWVMNSVRLLDCLDEDASMNVDRTGRRYVEVPVIDPGRLGPDDVLGNVKGYEVKWIMRSDLKLKIKKAGLTGYSFFPLATVDRPESMRFNKVDWSAEAEE
jgi:hypothetical protein